MRVFVCLFAPPLHGIYSVHCELLEGNLGRSWEGNIFGDSCRSVTWLGSNRNPNRIKSN